MARSRGMMQIVIGLIVIIVSYLMDLKSEEPKFKVFIFVGALFLGYGILKLIFYMLTREKKESRKKTFKELKNPHKIEALKNNKGPTHTHHPTIIACHSCDTKHYSNANYCQMCGSRFR